MPVVYRHGKVILSLQRKVQYSSRSFSPLSPFDIRISSIYTSPCTAVVSSAPTSSSLLHKYSSNGGCYHRHYHQCKRNVTLSYYMATTNTSTSGCFSSSSHSGGGKMVKGEEDKDHDATKNDHKEQHGPKLPASPPNNKSSAKNSSSSSILPGIGLSAMTALGGFQMASAISVASGIPMSGIPCAILLGMGIKNLILVKLPETSSSTSSLSSLSLQPGITYSTKTILQGGIVCVAAKLSFLDLLSAGSTGIPVVLSSVGAGLLFLPLAGRLAGLPSQMSLLLSAGTSICGVTAITALAPAIQAPPRDVAVAVANTVVFGTVGMICYPYIFHSLCHGGSEHVGMCLGVAIHDTSQVLGAALSYKETFGDEVAFQVAAVTKLMRNLGLAFAIPALTYVHASSVADAPKEDVNQMKKMSTMEGLNTFSKYIPPFLYAFLAMSIVRTGGDYLLQEDALKQFKNAMDLLGNDASKYALGTAMAGVGLSTNAASLRGVGWKPFAVGGAGALVVGGTGYTVASFLL